MRKTKIVCTLGPATDASGILQRMIEAGMNVGRFNFSHGTHADHKMRMDSLKEASEKANMPVAMLLDTKGPEIRLRHFVNEKEYLEDGQTFTLTTRDIMGSKDICSITYKELPYDVQKGSRIMLDDGLISMRVMEVKDTDIVCMVENGGPIKDRKGVNVPGVRLSMPYMSQQDKEDILFGMQEEFDYVAASFCRNEYDVLEVRRFIEENGGDMQIIAKIENQEGVDNIASIMAVADGVMIARGDMGVEIDFTEIPVIQKEIIARAMENGKTVITATQMLDSMMTNPRPTRAEITDVANAVYDGTSAIMLSGETAAGQYPVESVRTMAAIANRTEADINYYGRMIKATTDAHLGISDATAHAACTTATDTNASAIISVTKSGATAIRISKYRPQTPIIACVMEEKIQRKLALVWGVNPVLMPYAESTDEMIDVSVETTKQKGIVQDGEIAIITAGIPAGITGTTNVMKVHLVGSCLIAGVGIGEYTADGNLCICRNVDDIKLKFKDGDVLVVPRTNNDMLSYIHRASAVVVEEPGQASHAAVVGLSTGKAVITGAIDAMRILEDGMHVTVDCKRGIVQSLLD